MSRLIIGIQPVREAIRVHNRAIDVWLVQSKRSSDTRTIDGIERMARDQGARIQRVSRSKLDQTCRGGNHQGVIAFAPELRIQRLSDVLDTSPSLLTLLDRITDPQNFGAIIRSSVAFGANAIIWPEHDSAPLTAATFRASAGAVEYARLCRVRSLRSAIQTLRQENLHVIGLASEGSKQLDHLDLTKPTALVIGAEGSGLRKSVRSACNTLARLPTSAPLGTLNASVSAAISLYETRRQRRNSPEAKDASA